MVGLPTAKNPRKCNVSGMLIVGSLCEEIKGQGKNLGNGPCCSRWFPPIGSAPTCTPAMRNAPAGCLAWLAISTTRLTSIDLLTPPPLTPNNLRVVSGGVALLQDGLHPPHSSSPPPSLGSASIRRSSCEEGLALRSSSRAWQSAGKAGTKKTSCASK